MERLVEVDQVLGAFTTLFWIATLGMPFVIGGYMVFFNRDFTERTYGWNERCWGIRYPSWYRRLGRVFFFFMGVGFLIFGVFYAIQELTRYGRLLPE